MTDHTITQSPPARPLTPNEQRRCVALANAGVAYHVIESDDDVLRLREKALRIR